MKRIYLDHNASTPLDPRVAERMQQCMAILGANPSSIHAEGRALREVIEEARDQVADLLGADATQVIFTSGATESNNQAIRSTFIQQRSKGKHIICTAVEHSSVRNICNYLEEYHDANITRIPVNAQGVFDINDIKKAIRSDTILITCMWVNNETGNIYPVEEIGALAQEHGVLFHCDAVQAVGKFDINFNKLPMDFLTISGHKFNGPTGAGACLFKRKPLNFVVGGTQEKGLRSGTENALGIVGLGSAAHFCKLEKNETQARISDLSQQFWQALKEAVPQLVLNGHEEQRVPNTLNVSFPGLSGESLLMALDLEGIAVSAGSACASGTLSRSKVLEAMKCPDAVIKSAIRFSIGKTTTQEDIIQAIERVIKVVHHLYG